MSTRLCEGGCGREVSSRRRRCPACKKAYRAAKARDTYRAVRDRMADRYDGDDEVPVPEVVVDYSGGGAHRPTGRQPARNNVRHDTARRVAMDYQARQIQEAEMADQSSWDRVMGRHTADDRSTLFPAPSLGPERGFRGGRETPAVTDFHAAGMAYRPSPAAGQRMAAAQAHDRWGGRVSPGPPIHSSQISSAVPYVEQRERVQVEQERQASEHIRSMAAGWRRG